MLVGLTELLSCLLGRVLITGLFGLTNLLQTLSERLGELLPLSSTLLGGALRTTGFLNFSTEVDSVLRTLRTLIAKILGLSTALGLDALGANLIGTNSYLSD